MHPDAETRILSLALPLEEPNRPAFIKAASEAVEKLGPNAYGPGAIHRRLRRRVQRPVNVRDSDAEHPVNLRLALALNPQIANLPLALRVPVKGAQVVHGLGHASAPGNSSTARRARRGRWQAFQGGAVSCAPATKRAS